jgi:hypothetical protein
MWLLTHFYFTLAGLISSQAHSNEFNRKSQFIILLETEQKQRKSICSNKKKKQEHDLNMHGRQSRSL